MTPSTLPPQVSVVKAIAPLPPMPTPLVTHVSMKPPVSAQSNSDVTALGRGGHGSAFTTPAPAAVAVPVPVPAQAGSSFKPLVPNYSSSFMPANGNGASLPTGAQFMFPAHPSKFQPQGQFQPQFHAQFQPQQQAFQAHPVAMPQQMTAFTAMPSANMSVPPTDNRNQVSQHPTHQ